MNRDNQMKGSEKIIHNKMDAKELSIETKMDQLKERLSLMVKLLQERIEENQRCGWKLRKRVKWPIVQLFARNLRQNLRHRLSAWIIKEEKLREDEYRRKYFEA